MAQALVGSLGEGGHTTGGGYGGGGYGDGNSGYVGGGYGDGNGNGDGNGYGDGDGGYGGGGYGVGNGGYDGGWPVRQGGGRGNKEDTMDRWLSEWGRQYRSVSDRRATSSVIWWLIPLAFLVGGTVYGYLMTHPTHPPGTIDSPRQAVDS